LKEEVQELADAIEENDLVEIADALTDIQYVLSGAILAFGMQDGFKELFDEVQYSNMSKACSTKEEAQQTVKHYKEHRDTSSHIVEKDGKFLVLRDEDKKVLKSVNYHPANLQPILDTYIKDNV
jgi:predicted HAD superfamily Cof-like phosphohydrolase